MSTTHPTYPLQAEESDVIKTAMASPHITHHDIKLIHDRYDARRDTEFPGWLERYNAEMEQWFKNRKA